MGERPSKGVNRQHPWESGDATAGKLQTFKPAGDGLQTEQEDHRPRRNRQSSGLLTHSSSDRRQTLSPRGGKEEPARRRHRRTTSEGTEEPGPQSEIERSRDQAAYLAPVDTRNGRAGEGGLPVGQFAGQLEAGALRRARSRKRWQSSPRGEGSERLIADADLEVIEVNSIHVPRLSAVVPLSDVAARDGQHSARLDSGRRRRGDSVRKTRAGADSLTARRDHAGDTGSFTDSPEIEDRTRVAARRRREGVGSPAERDEREISSVYDEW